MNKKIVLALGGNAIGETPKQQQQAALVTAAAIAGLIQDGNQVVVTHGNGPQVGNISLAMATAAAIEPAVAPVSLASCVAMSQGYIGFDLQNALRDELLRRGCDIPVATLLTQTLVSTDDDAFAKPTKPIGPYFDEALAKQKEQQGIAVMEDAGRGWRKVVASPKPIDIVEKETILTLLQNEQVVIAAGGGGIPVTRQGDRLAPIDAVVDKDFASAKLAEIIDADFLIMLTGVEKVAINFNRPDQQWLDTISVKEAQQYIKEEQFAPGSMLPKVEAAIAFVQSKPGRKALITLLEKAQDGIAGKTGTVITA